MTTNKKIALVIIGGLYWLVTRVKYAVRNLAWRFRGVNIIASNNTTNSATVQLQLQLRNTTPVSLDLRAIVCDIYAQGVKVSSINQNYDLTIKGNSITTLDMLFEVYWTGVANAIKTNILSGDIKNMYFTFEGYLNIGGVKVAINQTITYYDLTA